MSDQSQPTISADDILIALFSDEGPEPAKVEDLIRALGDVLDGKDCGTALLAMGYQMNALFNASAAPLSPQNRATLLSAIIRMIEPLDQN